MCTEKLRHKDQIARCRFLVVSGGGPALLEMPDIELLSILKIMCDVVEGQQADRKFDSQTMEPSSAPSCKANTDWERRSDNMDVININSNMPDFFRSSMVREVGKRDNQLITQSIHNEFSDVFTGIGCFNGTFRLQVKKAASHTGHPLGG